MARKPKAPTLWHVVKALPPAQWTTLDKAHAQAVTMFDDADIAAGEMTKAARAGKLVVAVCELAASDPYKPVPFADRPKRYLILTKEFWRDSAITAGPFLVDVASPHRRGQPLPAPQPPQWHAIFARRADIARLYGKPPVAAATVAESLPSRRGAPVQWDWLAIDVEIACRCIHPKTRLVDVPERESILIDAMLEWCRDKHDKEPARSAMAERVRRMCAGLRKNVLFEQQVKKGPKTRDN